MNNQGRGYCFGSCGEFLQGSIDNEPILISCTIDMGSHITITQSDQHSTPAKPLVMKAIACTAAFFNREINTDQLAITHHSALPIAKGMASSTADIVAAIRATADFLAVSISNQETAAICASIEPSDSVMFPSPTLMNPRTGESLDTYFTLPNCRVLILESDTQIDTSEYYRDNNHGYEDISAALNLWRNGVKERDWYQLGKAATLSAIQNQQSNPKPLFETVIAEVQQLNCFGICTAHSGSVIGILYDPVMTTEHDLLSRFQTPCFSNHYPSIYSATICVDDNCSLRPIE